MFVSKHGHNVILVLLFKSIPLCKIVRSIEIDITFFLTSIHSKTTILVVSLDTYEKEEKKVKIYILFYNLCHYTDTIIKSMNFFIIQLQNCIISSWYFYEY